MDGTEVTGHGRTQAAVQLQDVGAVHIHGGLGQRHQQQHPQTQRRGVAQVGEGRGEKVRPGAAVEAQHKRHQRKARQHRHESEEGMGQAVGRRDGHDAEREQQQTQQRRLLRADHVFLPPQDGPAEYLHRNRQQCGADKSRAP